MREARRVIIEALRWSAPVLLTAALAVLAIYVIRQIPPQHAPWAELSLQHRVGLATHLKLARLSDDRALCQAAFDTAPDLQVRAAASDAGTQQCPLPNTFAFEHSSVSYGGEFASSCALAAALYVWEREVLQPAARRYLSTSVERIEQIGSFACRNIYNRSEGRISEHASANALDVTGFRFANGVHVSVLQDWGHDTQAGQFLDALTEGSCRIFSGVLTPAYNRAHRDHFHFDMGPYRICATGPVKVDGTR